MQVPIDEQIVCINRELGLRQKVYPKLIASGKMTESQARYELAAMDSVRETLLAVLAKEGQEGQMTLL